MILAIPSVAAQFTNQSELSIISTGGNSDLSTYNAKTVSKYVSGNNDYQLGGHLTKGKNGTVDSASNWDINARYGRKISDTIGAFFSSQYENDTFAGIAYRHNNDLGASYVITKTKKTNASAELGYRNRTQKSILAQVGQDQKVTDHQARLYSEVSRQNTDSFFTKMWLEYLPNFSESNDWQINVEPSLNFAMNANFSLKVGYLYKYDNQPADGSKRYDTTYSTTLIAKF
jgi:putative salt-induced outer membrane protein